MIDDQRSRYACTRGIVPDDERLDSWTRHNCDQILLTVTHGTWLL